MEISKYKEIGDSKKPLLLRNSGGIKLQWGNKFIDLLTKDGKLNVEQILQEFETITTVDNIENAEEPGIYYLFLNQEIKATVASKDSVIKKSEVNPVNIFEYKNVIKQFKLIEEDDNTYNQFFYEIYFKYFNDYLYQQGDILLFYISYQQKVLPIYLSVFDYDISENKVRVFVPTEFEIRSFDYTLLSTISDIECFLFRQSKKINEVKDIEKLDYENNSLKIGEIGSDKYRTEYQNGIVSKQSKFYSAQFDYDELDSDNQIPEYSSKLMEYVENLEDIPDNYLVPYGIIKKLLENNTSNSVDVELDETSENNSDQTSNSESSTEESQESNIENPTEETT